MWGMKHNWQYISFKCAIYSKQEDGFFVTFISRPAKTFAVELGSLLWKLHLWFGKVVQLALE